MRTFLDGQLDYIYFVYGLSLIVLSLIAFPIARHKDTRLPSRTPGVVWIVLRDQQMARCAVGRPDSSRTFACLRLTLLAVGMLYWWSSDGQVCDPMAAPGRWIYAPLLAAAGLGVFFGMKRV